MATKTKITAFFARTKQSVKNQSQNITRFFKSKLKRLNSDEPIMAADHPPLGARIKNAFKSKFEKLKNYDWSSLKSKKTLNGSGIKEKLEPIFQNFKNSPKWSELSEKIKSKLPKDVTSASELFEKGFNQIKNQKWTRYSKLIALTLSVYFLADLGAYFAESFIPEPPPPRLNARSTDQLRQTIDDYAAITTRNLFNSEGLIPGDNAGRSDAPPVKTTLPFNLIGTLILKNELSSLATIEDKSASLIYPVRVNDVIPSKAKITKVEPDRVIFLNLTNNQNEYAELPKDLFTMNPMITLGKPKNTSSQGGKKTIEQASPNRFIVPRSELDAALGDLNKILTQARAVPNWENGVFAGYKLFQIVPGSIYDKLGLKNGDTLLGVDGESIQDPGKAFEKLSQLKEKNNAEISIKRDGKEMSFSYDIN